MLPIYILPTFLCAFLWEMDVIEGFPSTEYDTSIRVLPCRAGGRETSAAKPGNGEA